MCEITSLAWARPDFDFGGRETPKCGRGEVKYPLDPGAAAASDQELEGKSTNFWDVSTFGPCSIHTRP